MVTKSQIFVNIVILVQDYTDIHLGHRLNIDDKDSIVSAAIVQFWSIFNLFCADFGHIQPYVQCKLFKQFCCNFYEVPLWLLSSHHVNDSFSFFRFFRKKCLLSTVTWYPGQTIWWAIIYQTAN